jgi:hypothetical protein
MRSVRHIPEAELHAYLDQALSRSQCVEIERHLAVCLACQSHRDGIAALRDQTTALLARLGPPLVLPPPYSSLEARFAERQRTRRRWVANGAWAASLVGAALLGWALNPAPVGSRAASPATVASIPAPVPVAPVRIAHDTPANVALNVQAQRPAPRPHQPRLMRAEFPATEPATWGFSRAVETDPSTLNPPVPEPAATHVATSQESPPDFSAQPVSAPPELAGLWRTIVPDSLTRTRGSDVPLVPGLTVVQMRVQPGQSAEDGEVTAVDQVLATGEMIRTIAGPAGRVGSLVDEHAQSDSAHGQTDGRVTVTFRQGDRMVAVTGPSDALGSLLSRVNTRRRY